MADVTTTFDGDGRPLEAVLKRLVSETRRFASVIDKTVSGLDSGFDQATAASAKLEAQQKKTNKELAKARQIEKSAKPQSTLGGGFIGPTIPLDTKGIQRVNQAMAVSSSQAKEIARQEQRRVLAQLTIAKSIKSQNSALKDTAAASKEVSDSAEKTGDEFKEVARQDAPSLRYALYDISNSLQRIAAGALALSAVPIGFGIKYERDFANVIRTNELAEGSIGKVRESLLEIARTTPINWRDITNIAALAGQLNIAEEVLASFTETTAKIAATTNLSVDAAATALGRLDQLISGVDGNFEALGSAILGVGVSSVSTESQIVNVAQNIASMGNLAGLSASDIVGLSGAIASLGIRPELARGNVTRLFSRINAAVAESGKKLDEFARLTGRTAEEFSYDWENNATPVLLDFFEGVNREGPKAERTLRDIGITSVRDIPAILRLAQSQDEVRRLVALSADEFLLGTKVNEQYAVVAETLAEQIKRLGQNFQILGAEAGKVSGFLAPVVGGLNTIVESLSRLAATPAGQVLSGVVIVAGLFVAALAGVGAALASTLAGMAALSFTARMTNIDLKNLSIGAVLSGQAFKSFAVQIAGADSGLAKFAKTAIRANAIFAIITTLLTVGALAWDAYTARQRRADEMQSRFFGNLSDYTDALIEDGKAVEAGAEAYKSWTPAIEENTDERLENLRASKDNLNIASDEKDAIENVTGALEAQTYAIGENVKERIRAQAIEIPEVAEIFGTDEIFSAIQEVTKTDDPFGEIFAAIASGQGDAMADQIQGVLRRRLSSISAELDRALVEGDPFGDVVTGLREDFAAAEAAVETFEVAGVAMFDSIDGGLIGLAKTSIAADRVGESMEDAGDETALTDQKLRQITTDLFGAENAMKKTREAAQDFGKAIFDSGGDLEITNEALQNFINGVVQDPFSTSAEKIAILNGVLTYLKDNNIAAATTTTILNGAIQSLATGSGLVEEDLSNLNQVVQEIAGALDVTGILDSLGLGLGGVASSANSAASSVKTLNEQFDELVSSIFEPVNAAQSASRAIADLGEAYAELGEDAFYASQEVQDAVSNILDISSTPEEGIANLNALYSELASTVGSETAPSLVFLRNTIDQVASSFGVAADAVAGATVDLDFFNLGVQQAQQEVRTLSDYAGDLESVISRAFDIRFASTFEIDRIAEAWFDLTNQVEDAQYAVEELIATQSSLGSDRALKEYFLSVAEAYGDTLRASQLRKEISDLDRQQAQNARELEEAQQIAGGDLSSQGPGSRQNRAALLGLVGDYQGYITTLAESGAGQEELAKATERARKEFIAQATELGFQESVVLEYAQAFDDVKTAIDRVPRNITVDADTNPAIQALNELNAKLNDSIDLARELNRVQSIVPPTPPDPKPVVIAERTGLASVIAADEARFNSLRSRLGFASGGYTGAGGKYQPAGIVHRGEYVVPSQHVNQSSGLPNANFLSQLQNGVPGYANGGFVGGGGMGDGAMMVELSPYDRKLLEDAGNVQLRVDGKVVASATNRSNFNEARRGSN